MEGSLGKEEQIKALCFLYKENDQQNRCLLGENSLKVIYRSREYYFDLSTIKNITFETRKLMFPLIFGGVSSTFIIISILKNLFNPWISLTILVASLAISYFGWAGTNVLTIKEKGHQNDFMLKHVSINMKAFIRYVNRILSFKRGVLTKSAMFIYHITTREHWEKAIGANEYSHASLNDDGFIHASDKEDVLITAELYFKELEDLVLLAIDPEKVTSPIKYEVVPERNSLFPHIFGPINLEAIVAIPPFKKNISGKFEFPNFEIPVNR